jgi:hypothetical protein
MYYPFQLFGIFSIGMAAVICQICYAEYQRPKDMLVKENAIPENIDAI